MPVSLTNAACVLGLMFLASSGVADEFALELRSQQRPNGERGSFQRVLRAERWSAEQTAVIVCDVWDLHHCLNAVRRLEEFAPRLNQVLAEGRRRGATIIHAPSDCMPAYADHPARLRAVAVPKTPMPPSEIEFWCSRIPSEEQAVYPIDQSDGGEDDDPAEHQQWSAKLQALGRNPGMPWKKQSELITIDPDQDYISDRGDEVWSVLEHRGIRNVILTGVHCNMCVLGRPFGLRQMARHGKHVVLMRDLTDSMYNPRRWPYVDHFTGHDLVVSHVERFVCPTITSDQLLGGEPFRWKGDTRPQRDVTELSPAQATERADFERHWTVREIPGSWQQATNGVVTEFSGPAWYRCAVRIPQTWLAAGDLELSLAGIESSVELWVNGHSVRAISIAETSGKSVRFSVPADWVVPDDANLIVLRVEHRSGDGGLRSVPQFQSGARQAALRGRWQFRFGDDPSFANMPLPARFGTSPDILHRL